MPQGATFLDELSRLNQQNFLGGIAEGAQALKEKTQNDSLVNLYNEFRQKQAGLSTTDQTVSDFNKDLSSIDWNDEVKATTKFAELSAKALNNLQTLTQKNDELTNVYAPTIASLTAIGTTESLNLAKTLSNELTQKKSDLEAKIEMPLKAMEYQSKVLDISRNILNIQSGTLALQEAKKKFQEDTSLKGLLVDMMQDQDGQQLLRWGTGAESVGTILKDDPKVKETTDRLYSKFGSNPAFMSAMTLIAGGKNFYRRSVLLPSGTGTGTANGVAADDKTFVDAFTSLMDDSKLWDNVHTANDNDYPYGAVKQIVLGTKDEKGQIVLPTGLDSIQDPAVKNLAMDYVNSFMKTGKDSYNKRFEMASALAKKYGKTLGFDFTLEKYGLSGKDILYFNQLTDKPIYEPYLYYRGYYQKKSGIPPSSNLFAPTNNRDWLNPSAK